MYQQKYGIGFTRTNVHVCPHRRRCEPRDMLFKNTILCFCQQVRGNVGVCGYRARRAFQQYDTIRSTVFRFGIARADVQNLPREGGCEP